MLVLCFMVCTTCLASGKSLFDQGMKELQKENYEEALQYFLNARAAEPKSSRIAYCVGLTYKFMENYPAAIPYLRDAVTLTPRVDEAFVPLIDVLYNTDNLKEADKWIAVAEKDRVNPAQVQYLKGLVLIKENKPELAIEAFEKAKKLDPHLTQQAELQIATAYAQQGKFNEARERLHSSITLNPESDAAVFARDYEKIITDRMEREKPWRFSVGFAYKFDTNVVAKGSGPLTDTISGSEDSALNFSARIGYTAPFSFRTPYSLSVNYALYADRYFGKNYTRADGTNGNLTEYNNMTNQFSLTPGYSFGGGRFALSLPITYSHVSLQGEKGLGFYSDEDWVMQTRYMESTSVAPTIRFLTTTNSFGEVSFGYMRKKYFDTELHPLFAPEEERSGERLTIGTAWFYSFSEAKGLFDLRGSYSQENTIGRNWTNDESRFGTDILCPIFGPLKFQASADAIFVNYKFENTFFNERRSDEIYSMSVGLIYNIFKNTDLIAQYYHCLNTSNIDLYDYKRKVYTLGMEYRF
jgi:tetratricopeptide (TPR) repeat protein